MQGRAPEPCRRRHCPAQAGWPHRRARRKALRHAGDGDGATRRGLTSASTTKALKAAHLRQTGPTPQVKAPESGRNPGKFQTAVRDLVSTTETLIGQTGWSKALVRH